MQEPKGQLDLKKKTNKWTFFQTRRLYLIRKRFHASLITYDSRSDDRVSIEYAKINCCLEQFFITANKFCKKNICLVIFAGRCCFYYSTRFNCQTMKPYNMNFWKNFRHTYYIVRDTASFFFSLSLSIFLAVALSSKHFLNLFFQMHTSQFVCRQYVRTCEYLIQQHAVVVAVVRSRPCARMYASNAAANEDAATS